MPRMVNGDRLFTHLTLKLFLPGNKKRIVRNLKPPQGMYINSTIIEAQLMAAAKEIDRKFPQHEYRLVPTGPASFNFVWVREKAANA